MEPTLIERTDKEIDTEALNELTVAVGWGCRSRLQWERILKCSTYVYSLWADGTLVGFGRILEDGTMAMFYDIAVHPNYQRSGVGTRIMEYLISKAQEGDYASIGLFAWDKNPGAKSFYEKLGFESVAFGMKLKKRS